MRKIFIKRPLLLLIFSIIMFPAAYFVVVVFENLWSALIFIIVLLISGVFLDREVSKAQPDLDNPLSIGNSAEVLEPFIEVANEFEGFVKLNGVRWKARCQSTPLKEGDIVVVKNQKGLVLEVERHKKIV
jgi:membrane protein implicated in regulation of membrane protease activity